MDLKKYFTGSGKKGELRDKSTNSDHPKKQREGSLNDSQNVDDIFSEGLFSPDCVAVLVICIKNVEKHIVQIFSKTEEIKYRQIKSKQHLLELNKAVTLISEKFDEYEREKLEREKIMKEMQKEIKDMSASIQSFKISLVRQEQYCRRNCLLIHGLCENKNEMTPIKLILILKEN